MAQMSLASLRATFPEGFFVKYYPLAMSLWPFCNEFMGEESRYIHKSHTVPVLLSPLVSSAKYRRVIFSNEIDVILKDICLEISCRYEIHFLETGTDKDHVDFLIQSVPMYSPKKITQTIKSLAASEIFKRCPEVKRQLWGGEFRGKGYFINTVGQHGNEDTIARYVREQGKEKEDKR